MSDDKLNSNVADIKKGTELEVNKLNRRKEDLEKAIDIINNEIAEIDTLIYVYNLLLKQLSEETGKDESNNIL